VTPLPAVPLALAGLLLLAALSVHRQGRSTRFAGAMGAFFLLAGWAAGSLEAIPRRDLLADSPAGEARVLLGEPVMAEAVVVEETRRSDEFLTTGLRLMQVRRRGVVRHARDRVRLYGPPSGPFLKVGERVQAWLVLRRVREYANGRPESRHRRPLAARLKSPLLVEAIESEGWSARRVAGLVRSFCRRRLEEGLALGGAPPRVRALAVAVLLGDRTGVAEADRRHLTDGGAAHVLAISGLHMTVLLGLLAVVLRRAGLGARGTSALILGAIPAYTALLPVRPSVVRAALMGLAVPFARLSGRESVALNMLGGAGLLFLVISPGLATEPGFLLSFTVTAALIHVAPPPVRGGWTARIRNLLAASAVATAASLPLTSYFFGRATPAAVLVNLLAVPAAAVLVSAAAGSTILAAVHPLLAAPLAPVAALAVEVLFWATSWPRWIPWGHVLVPTGRPCLVTAAIVTLFAGRRGDGTRRAPALWASAALQTALLLGASPPSPLPPGELALRVLDVGQGDALIIGLPDGEAILVDGGGVRGSRTDIGRSVVLPALLDAGVRRLRAVALSHPHFDHGGGLAAVLEEVDVDELWLPSLAPGNELVAGLVERAMEAGTAVRVLRRGDVLDRGGARVTCLSPGPGQSRLSPNHQSLVLRITAATGSLLLPGDLEEGAETLLASGKRPLTATVLKVAHHGSSTSTREAFLSRVQPAVAVISVGRVNPWDHPHQEVLQRLAITGIPSYRTDLHGAVTVVVGPEGPSISTARGGAALTPPATTP
jgi:competence protein ComEC